MFVVLQSEGKDPGERVRERKMCERREKACDYWDKLSEDVERMEWGRNWISPEIISSVMGGREEKLEGEAEGFEVKQERH